MKNIKIIINLKEHFECQTQEENLEVIDYITGFMGWKEHVAYLKKQVRDYLQTEQEFGKNQKLIDAYETILKELQ